MKHFLLLLAFLLPSFSFANVVPPQIPVQINNQWASTTWTAFPFSPANVLFEYVSGSDLDFGSPYTSYYNQSFSASSPNLTTGTTSSALGITQACAGASGGLPMNDYNTYMFSRIPDSELIACGVSYGTSTDDYIYVNFYGVKGTGPYIYDLFGYAKFRFDGTRWVDTLGAGASGSWTFSTSTPINPIDFSSFAQGLKDVIANNTYQPLCSGTTIADLFTETFWQDCVLPTIFNWLFVPSDSAIDYMVEQMSSNAQYGSSFAYMLIMPVASAVSVTACDLDDVPSCSVGSPLTLPLLDVHGSSTPFVLDPVSPLPAYFDDWLSAIVSVLILAGVSRVVLLKFL